MAAGPFAVADADEGAARTAAAACTAWYLTSMGDIYSDLVSAQGFAAEVEAIVAANPRPSQWTGIVPGAAQPLLDAFNAYGTAARVRSQLEKWDQVADVVMVGLPPGMPWSRIEGTLRAAAPA